MHVTKQEKQVKNKQYRIEVVSVKTVATAKHRKAEVGKRSCSHSKICCAFLQPLTEPPVRGSKLLLNLIEHFCISAWDSS